MPSRSAQQIGTLAETSLHADLKARLARPGDQSELKLEGFIIDLVRGKELIEIQTGNFSALKPKFTRLLDDYRVRLVYPVAVERWIQRQSAEGSPLSRRKSPKRGRVEEVFAELVYIPDYLPSTNLSIEVMLIQEEQIFRDDGQGSWRRKGWSLFDRRLLGIRNRVLFRDRTDYLALIPPDIPRPFTNRDLAKALSCRPSLAGKITYTLRKAGWIEVVAREGAAHLHEVI